MVEVCVGCLDGLEPAEIDFKKIPCDEVKRWCAVVKKTQPNGTFTHLLLLDAKTSINNDMGIYPNYWDAKTQTYRFFLDKFDVNCTANRLLRISSTTNCKDQPANPNNVACVTDSDLKIHVYSVKFTGSADTWYYGMMQVLSCGKDTKGREFATLQRIVSPSKVPQSQKWHKVSIRNTRFRSKSELRHAQLLTTLFGTIKGCRVHYEDKTYHNLGINNVSYTPDFTIYPSDLHGIVQSQMIEVESKNVYDMKDPLITNTLVKCHALINKAGPNIRMIIIYDHDENLVCDECFCGSVIRKQVDLYDISRQFREATHCVQNQLEQTRLSPLFPDPIPPASDE